MAFNTIEYFGFLALVLAIYYGIARTEFTQKLLIVAASALFYAFWSSAFLIHFLIIVSLNYWAARAMEGTSRRRVKLAILWITIVLDLANLGIWKYASLIVESINWSASVAGLPDVSLSRPNLILPLAISFYTFHLISYIVDLHCRQSDARPKGFLDFLFYVVFFPHQIAGPILRGHELFPQIGYKNLRGDDFQVGAQRVVIGLFQKAVIADNLSIVADHGFTSFEELSAGEIYVTLLAYSFQIFFDFSGYTNMGIGSARMLGYRLPENFDSPYLARNISDFWRRWHMTLSRWIRDYIFIPMGGSQVSEMKIARNLLVTMGLAGLWHGASWSFVVWGLLHGAALFMHRWFRRCWRLTPSDNTEPSWIGRLAGILVTFHFVTLAWVLFRAPDLPTAINIYERLLLGLTGDLDWSVDESYLLKTYGFTAMFVYGIGLWIARSEVGTMVFRYSHAFRLASWAGVVYLIVALAPERTDPFIYFQF